MVWMLEFDNMGFTLPEAMRGFLPCEQETEHRYEGQ